MATGIPNSPMTGKSSKVYISFGDGAQLVSTVMTEQTSYSFKGETFANRIYLLGTGKTLINMRPAILPRVDVDGISDGILLGTHASNDTVTTTAGNLLVDNVAVAVAADTSVSVTRPAATQGAWMAIHVHKVTGAFTSTKGTDTADAQGKTSLLQTFGAAAGQKPLIPTTDLLIGCVSLTNGAALVLSTEFDYGDRETADIDPDFLPNIGGCKLPTALVACHAGTLKRQVKFNGYYLDGSLSEISTHKGWDMAASANTISESLANKNVSTTEISGWTFTFDQLATDSKIINITLNKQAYGAAKLLYASGTGFQGAVTLAPNLTNKVGSYAGISVSGNWLDDPVPV